MVAPFSKFTAKFGLVFILTLEKPFSQRFHFQANRKSIVSSKKRYYFQNSPPFERSNILNIFNTLTLKKIFQKTKTFLKKLEYRFLVERTEVEKASFPYKTAISEANVKTNRMVTTKWAYHRERIFASNYFIF